MEGWIKRPLGELLEVQNGYAFKSSQFSIEGEMPLIRIRDLGGCGETETRYSGDYDLRYVVHEGDLLVGMDGDFECHPWKGPPALLNQRVCRLEKFSESLVSGFLRYGIGKYLDEIHAVTGFTTVKHLSSKTIQAILFPVPPLDEQRRIVAILDEAFAAIETATAAAEKNLANARELFESVLRSCFVAQTANAALTPLGKLCRFEGGSQPPKSTFVNSPRPGYVRLLQIRDFTSDSKAVYIPESKVKRKCEATDIMIGRYGASVGQIHRGKSGSYNVALIKTIPDESQIDKEYFYYYLRSPCFQENLAKVADRSAQAGFGKSDIEGFEVPVPSLAEQRQHAFQFEQLESQSVRCSGLISRKLALLGELKQSLLQKAFRGEL